MSSRDQPFSDRASVFWGTTALEQFARVPRQRQLSLQRSDALVGCGELVGLHAWVAFDHASIRHGRRLLRISAWRFHRKSVAWQTPVSAATTATGSADRRRATICRRTDDEYIPGM